MILWCPLCLHLSLHCIMLLSCRCVADEQRTFALGIQSFLFRLFGNIPGPIVFGAVFDVACIFRNFSFPCGSTESTVGACWVYNTELLANSILAMVLIALGMNLLFSFLSWISYPKPQNKQDDHKDVRNGFQLKKKH